MVFLHGGGGEGKSTFLNTVSRIAGDYAVTATMEAFIASRNDRHSTELAMLRGARMVTASETEENRAWAEARIKALTGGDPITARFMRQDNFTFCPQFKLTIVGNHRPTIQSVDDAMRRRFNIVPFTRKPANPDSELPQKLLAEAPAILRWMIDGCIDWQANGLRRPPIVVDATAEYFSAQDMLAQWIEDECDAEPGNDWKRATSADLFASWSAYAKRAGEAPQSRKVFSDALAKKGFVNSRGSGGVRTYQGIRLKPTSDASDV